MEGKGQGMAPVAWGEASLGTRNLKSLRHRAVQGGGCTDHCSRTCSLETGKSRLPSSEGRGSGSPSPFHSVIQGERSGLAILHSAPPRGFSGTVPWPSFCTVAELGKWAHSPRPCEPVQTALLPRGSRWRFLLRRPLPLPLNLSLQS